MSAVGVGVIVIFYLVSSLILTSIAPLQVQSLVCHFSWEDERGEDGVVVMPDGGSKKVLIGTRMASTKTKRQHHETKDSQEEAHQKASEALDISTVRQDRHLFCTVIACRVVLLFVLGYDMIRF